MSRFIENQLIKAVENILGRSLNEVEKARLTRAYQQASGSTRQKVNKALEDFFSWTPEQRSAKASAADNTGRSIRELEDSLQGE